MAEIPRKALVTERSGGFSQGRAFCAPGDAKGAGGGNLKKKAPPTVTTPSDFNNKVGFRRGGKMVRYDDEAVPSIKAGSTSPSR